MLKGLFATLLLLMSSAFSIHASDWELQETYDQAVSIEYLHGENNLKGVVLHVFER